MTKTAWVFPGQGSQAIGMGADLYNLPAAQAKFQQAEQILGWSVPEICQNLDDKVSRTLYTQPCLYVIESILADLMRDRGEQPDLVAGHSLGEYVALYVAGVFDFESGLRLVKRRAELMDAASEGVMAALLGFDREQLEQQIAQTPDVVLANDNNAGQVVISGSIEAVDAILANVKAKRAVNGREMEKCVLLGRDLSPRRDTMIAHSRHCPVLVDHHAHVGRIQSWRRDHRSTATVGLEQPFDAAEVVSAQGTPLRVGRGIRRRGLKTLPQVRE
ncbi:acyltransferase domain-containing protein [Leptolyngbya sp. 7M]|uniref:acyltransferase domain-containing protein n=1 Tax=Leptolyngbya sp. 7M TaxID=2812896 RepID=UPI001B8BCD4B|nr:acyltransferase domain-containing protein [Leptolyngbya sp. 7M]QYO64053.1 acyltransferase domain-containing protein [Leptolyngbya sp. 7M]